MGNFGISEGNITERKKKKKTEYVPNPTPRGKVAQTLASATSKRVLNREAWVACLG